MATPQDSPPNGAGDPTHGPVGPAPAVESDGAGPLREPGGFRRTLGRIHRVLGRLWRGMRRPRSASGIQLVYDRNYTLQLPQAIFDGQRAQKILSFLATEKLIRRRNVHRPQSTSLASLERIHDPGYLDSLQDPETAVSILGFALPPKLYDQLLLSHRSMSGGTVRAARLALQGASVAINLGGGFHHAQPDKGSGFCAFNDIALAVDDARRRGFTGKVLVIDLDIHDGDGTRRFFAADESVHTFSLHNRNLDESAALADTCLELGENVGDDAYLEAIERYLPTLLEEARPGLVFYVAGCDPAHDDKLGNWQISSSGMLKRDVRVMDMVRELVPGTPVVIVLAGGYGGGAWRYSARFFSWLLNNRKALDPLMESHATLGHYRKVARMLDLSDVTGTSGEQLMQLGPEDLPGGWVAPPSLFLDYYTQHGIELALERFGLLSSLRAKGFDHPALELELEGPMGHTLRVLSDEGEQSRVLVELRVRRDRALIKGLELLIIEWMLLQNPNAVFTPQRPRLPGQHLPGLGMMRDVMALLIMACENIPLDGVGFTPSHYHIAMQGYRLFRLVDPATQARFEALRESLSGRSLVESIELIEGGRVVDARTGEPFRWEPTPLLLPVSRRAKRLFEDGSYSHELEQARSLWSFRIAGDDDEGEPT